MLKKDIMSFKKISLLKLKKKCQETLYNSISTNLDISEAQTYIPAFTHALNFDNNYSKKMFIFNSKYVLLEVLKEKIDENDGTEKLNLNDEEERKSNLNFEINEKLQGSVIGKVVNKNLYSRSKDYSDYQRFIGEIPMFLKCNPLLDIINYMEEKYEFRSEVPSIFSYLTNNKINDINNNAYLEVICAYFLNLLNEEKQCSLFPHYYGAFNGLAENYVHDISEDYPHIRGCRWFQEKNEKLNYEIIRDNNLDDYQELSLKNVERIDYEVEKDLQHKTNMENEINCLDISEWEDLKVINLENTNLNLNHSSSEEDEVEVEDDENIEEYDIIEENNCSDENKSDSDSNNDSKSGSSDSLSDLSSQGSCIFNETYIKIKNFPVQILALEKLDITLTKLVKDGISVEEWKVILFEICFGLSVAQQKYLFIHNDLHSDNIMFKKIDTEFKYYRYRKQYFKVPTFNRETKVIDFARGIIQIGKKTYFSDVFKKEGDAGGQYNYLHKQTNKKYNYSFDLARLGTTIAEFLDNSQEKKELFNLIKEWTENKYGDNFLDMDDDFSLYVAICETANNAIPKNQLLKKLFQSFQVNKEDIPDLKNVYQLD